MRVLSWRWWFENRETGRVTIAQFPNLPLFAAGAAWVVGRLADEGSATAEVTHWASIGLWCYWAGDEVARGVNPWRRVLGASVLAWHLGRLTT